ncbi:MAG: tyrosine-type recombinase/integrase [Acidimicrobiales bacterium]
MIERGDVRDWATELRKENRSAATIRHAVGTLSRVVALAVEEGALRSNPCLALRLASPRPTEMLVFTIPQVERLANVIQRPVLHLAGQGARPPGEPDRPDLALWVRLAAYCGLRAGEAGALRRGRIDLDHRRLTVAESLTEVSGHLVFGPPKSGKTRVVPIPSVLLAPFTTHLAARPHPQNTLVFATRRGNPVRHAYLYRRHFKPAVLRAGLAPDLRFHDLRQLLRRC